MKYFKYGLGVRIKNVDGVEYLVDEKLGRGIVLSEENKEIILQLLETDRVEEIAANLAAAGFECEAEYVESFLEYLTEHNYICKLDVPALRKLTIYLTNGCNLSCHYCMFSSGNPMQDELKTGEIYDLIQQGVELGIEEIVLTGGEPLVREDFEQIVAFIRKHAIKLSIDTNGVLITEDVVKRWVELGVDEVELSLDGCDRETNDLLRGAGTFDHTMRVVEWCKKHGLPFTIASVICKPNLSQHKELGEFIISLGASKYNGSEVRMLGRALTHRDDFELTQNENIEVILYGDLWRKLHCPNRSSQKKEEFNVLSDESFDCNIGMAALVISPTGNVIPCGTFPMDQPVCGNIRQKKLAEIWLDDPFLRKVRKLSVQWIDECNDCLVKHQCGGGCRAISYKEFGNVDAQPDRESCDLKKGIFIRIGEFYNTYGPNFEQWYQCLKK